MKITKKSNKLSTKHGIERYHSRIKNIGDIDSKLKYIRRKGHTIDYYYGAFYKYLLNKHVDNKIIIIHENYLYIFEKYNKILITTYPIPDEFLPTKKYFLSNTKKSILSIGYKYIGKTVIITFFNRKVTAHILDVEISDNNMYFTATTSTGILLHFSFEDIYNIEFSKDSSLDKFSLKNKIISETIINFFLNKQVILITPSNEIPVKLLNKYLKDNETYIKFEYNSNISEIKLSDLKDIQIFKSTGNPESFIDVNISFSSLYSEKEKKQYINGLLGKRVKITCSYNIFSATLLNTLIINGELWIRIKKDKNSRFLKMSDIYNIEFLQQSELCENICPKNFEQINSLKNEFYKQSVINLEFKTLLKNINILSNHLCISGVKTLPVKHEQFGEGKVSYFIQNNVIVDFENGISKNFLFPNCFYNNTLMVLNKRTHSKKLSCNTKNYYIEEIKRTDLLLKEISYELKNKENSNYTI